MTKEQSSPETPVTDRPLAMEGLISYRAKSPYGWIMIGATDDADALVQARRSSPKVEAEALQVWDGHKYVPCLQSHQMALSSPEIRILKEVFTAMKNFGAPMLLDEKYWVEASKMADAGLLERHEKIFESCGYSLTENGLKALQTLPVAEPQPLIKAWGETVPGTLKAKIAFIASQAKPMEQAKYLEYTTGEGKNQQTVTYTLSESALDAKLLELGYKRGIGEDACRDRFNFGDEDSDSFCLCEETGALLDGNWSNDPDGMIYCMSGFAWRRENGFQMEGRDWQEAHGYLSRLDPAEATALVSVICESCFLDPRTHNDTGLYNPGGPCDGDMDDLIALFDFLKEAPDSAEHPRG